MTTLESLLVVLGGVLGVAFVGLGTVTVAISFRGRRRDRHRAKGREGVRTAMITQVYSGDSDWKPWLETLSGRERGELESVLERYLRTVRGNDRERFLELAATVDLGRRAEEALESDGRARRLRALATLALVDHPVDADRLFETCAGDRRTREAGARVFYERRDAYDSPDEWGTKLLLAEPGEPLTIHGMETLFALNSGLGTPVLSMANEGADEWSEALLVQVCRVLEFCQVTGPDSALAWLVPLFEHEEPAVRASAVRVLKRHGWRDSFREEVPYRELITDDSPEVRRAVYETLAYWGDEEAHRLLEWVVVDEADPRCQLVAIRGLISVGADPETSHPGWPARAWRWVETEVAVDDTKQLASSVEQAGGVRA